MATKATPEAISKAGLSALSVRKYTYISPPPKRDKAAENPWRCVRKKGDSHAAFAQINGGTIRASQAMSRHIPGAST